jgi:hypothetical protein
VPGAVPQGVASVRHDPTSAAPGVLYYLPADFRAKKFLIHFSLQHGNSASIDSDLVHGHAAPALELQIDRADAMRLLKALVAGGMDTRAPRTNAWIQKKASEIGLEGSQFVSALAYAGNEGWLADAPRRGWTSLTGVGETIARR